jgi:hypothetical protein
MWPERVFARKEIGFSSHLSPIPVQACALVFCPVPWKTVEPSGAWVQNLYQLAYNQAQASLLPPWFERLLVASPN